MVSQKGIFIVIEGADGSGKATQTDLLKEYFEEKGVGVETFSFPRYDRGRSGRLMGELLRGDHGDFMSVSPYMSSLPYVINRVAARDELRAALDSGKIVICDRYLPSNLAHQSAKLKANEEKDAFIEFCEELEYDELQMPRPTAVIYLSVPVVISTELVEDKGARGWLAGMRGKKDLAERNLGHQEKARSMYEKFAKERDEWHMVECVSDGEMRTRKDIHQEIRSIIKNQKSN